MNRRTYLAPGAQVVGDVTLGENVGIWYNAVVRGDTGSIFIGDNSNVQDNSTLHTDEGHSIHIGKGVSIGHNAVVHGCTVGDNTVVGMGSIILSGAVVGKNCIIGAGALVTGKMVIPDNSMAFGNPAKVVRQLTEEEVEDNRHNAEHYVDLIFRKHTAQQCSQHRGSLRSHQSPDLTILPVLYSQEQRQLWQKSEC